MRRLDRGGALPHWCRSSAHGMQLLWSGSEDGMVAQWKIDRSQPEPIARHSSEHVTADRVKVTLFCFLRFGTAS